MVLDLAKLWITFNHRNAFKPIKAALVAECTVMTAVTHHADGDSSCGQASSRGCILQVAFKLTRI